MTPQWTTALAAADRTGRVLVTMIDGRVCLVLPVVQSEAEQAALIARVVRALEGAGL